MNELLTTQSLEGTPLTISATSMPSLDGMGTGAIRSSVFEINNSSSNVNFIAHVWACCSDLLLAEEAYGPKGRQGSFLFENSFGNAKKDDQVKTQLSGFPRSGATTSLWLSPNSFQ